MYCTLQHSQFSNKLSVLLNIGQGLQDTRSKLWQSFFSVAKCMCLSNGYTLLKEFVPTNGEINGCKIDRLNAIYK